MKSGIKANFTFLSIDYRYEVKKCSLYSRRVSNSKIVILGVYVNETCTKREALVLATLRYAYTGRGVSEKVSSVGFCLGSGLFGSCNSD